MSSLGNKILKGIQEVPIEISRFTNGSYPSFVTSDRVQELLAEVPVFMFHTVNKIAFQQQLEFLKNNHYQTLSLEAFIAFLKGKLELKQPSVVLTFDDGEKSWYEIAYPLLKKYGFQAIGFVVPSCIKEEPLTKKIDKTWLAWSELKEMDASGVLKIQSHSQYHDLIFTQPNLVDFFHPQFNADGLGLDTPWIEEDGNYTNHLKLGTPIYSTSPRLAGKPRYIENPEVKKACVAYVDAHGGRDFFDNPNWKQELLNIHKVVIKNFTEIVYESEIEQRAKIRDDLNQAKQILEEKLNKPIKHLCYPWGQGSDLSVEISQEVGYESNFWVSLKGRNNNTPGDSPWYIPRLKDDYLLRLPGHGRKPLWKIFQEKLRRRAATTDLY